MMRRYISLPLMGIENPHGLRAWHDPIVGSLITPRRKLAPGILRVTCCWDISLPLMGIENSPTNANRALLITPHGAKTTAGW